MAEQCTLKKEWEDYRSKCYPDGMFPEQEKQVYSAFFAGCLTALMGCSSAADLSEDDGANLIGRLINEAMTACEEQAKGCRERN